MKTHPADQGDEFSIVDTPGFTDRDNYEEESRLVDETMSVLKDKVKSVNAVILLIRGTDHALSRGMITMMKIMQSMFGKGVWKNLVIGVSQEWSFRDEDIRERDNTGRFKHQFLQCWNDLLKNLSFIDEDIPGILKQSTILTR